MLRQSLFRGDEDMADTLSQEQIDKLIKDYEAKKAQPQPNDFFICKYRRRMFGFTVLPETVDDSHIFLRSKPAMIRNIFVGSHGSGCCHNLILFSAWLRGTVELNRDKLTTDQAEALLDYAGKLRPATERPNKEMATSADQCYT